MVLHGIPIPHKQLADFCRRHGVTRLSLFGSILRDDFGPDSDIDVLVEIPASLRLSLLDLGGMQQELCDLFGRQVDMKAPGFIADHVLPRVLHEARLLYAA
jgi:predicted nucleotidyltransferase